MRVLKVTLIKEGVRDSFVYVYCVTPKLIKCIDSLGYPFLFRRSDGLSCNERGTLLNDGYSLISVLKIEKYIKSLQSDTWSGGLTPYLTNTGLVNPQWFQGGKVHRITTIKGLEILDPSVYGK